jgi:hypothetical protein
MGYRLLLYIVEILRDFYNNSDENERKRKDFKFPAVIPLVYYTGNGKWTAPLNIREMFDGYENYGDYVLNFNYALIDVKGYDEAGLENLQSKLLKLIMLFEQTKDFDSGMGVVEKHFNDIRNLSEEEQRILHFAIEILERGQGENQNYDIKKAIYGENAEEAMSMLADIRANAQNFELSVEKRGRQEEKKEMARTMLLNKEPMDKIMLYTKLTEAEIKKISNTLK